MSAEDVLQRLREASADNEKIAALLLVPRAVRAGEVREGERRLIFDAVGFPFLNRLLNTKDEPETSSPSAYQRLALTLLACFTTDPELATHIEVTSKIPLLLQFIATTGSGPETVALQEDCVQVLLSLTHSPRGTHLLVSSGCPQTAAKALVTSGGSRPSLRQLLVHLLSHSAVVSRHREVVEEVVGLLASQFRDNQDQLKFELCDILYSVLSVAGEVLVQGRELWIRDVAVGLCDILSSKISSAMRLSALLLSAQLCQVCGAEWTFTSGDSSFFRLLGNLAAVEVQVSVEGQGLEVVSLHSELLCCCCVILETSVGYISSQTPLGSTSVLTEKDMLQLHSAFSEAIKSITEFLNSLSLPLPHDNPLISAAVHVLGAWLAEESLIVPTELHQLLPRLLDMCKAHQQQIQGQGGRTDCASVEERCLENPLKFLLPGLSHLVADDVPRAIMKTLLPHLLLDYMKTLYTRLPRMSCEAVSSFTLSVEILVTVCVCEVEMRRGSVFCELAGLLSGLIVCDSPAPRLALEVLLLWLMVAREQGRKCCAVEWSDMWHKVAEILVATVKLCHSPIEPDPIQSQSSNITTTVEPAETLAELWHLTVREVMAIAMSMADVKQLLLKSECVGLLAKLNTQSIGEEELEAARRLMEALHTDL